MIERASRAIAGNGCPGKGQTGRGSIGTALPLPLLGEPKSTVGWLRGPLAKQMATKSAPSSPPKRRGNPNWVKGGPSPNPNGRPRTGLAQAELIREVVDPQTGIDLMERIVTDESIPLERRLAAYLSIADRGYVRPPQGHDVNVANTTAMHSYEHLSEERTRALLAEIRGESPGGDPATPDEDS